MSAQQKRSISERTAENAAVQVVGTFATLGAVAAERELVNVTAKLKENTHLLYGVSAIIEDPYSRELVADANMVQALVRLAKDGNLRGLLLGVRPDAAALTVAKPAARGRKLRSSAKRMKHLYMADYMEAVVLNALRRLNKHDLFNADQSGNMPAAVSNTDPLKVLCCALDCDLEMLLPHTYLQDQKGILLDDLTDILVIRGESRGEKLKDMDLAMFTKSAGWYSKDDEKKLIHCSINTGKVVSFDFATACEVDDRFSLSANALCQVGNTKLQLPLKSQFEDAGIDFKVVDNKPWELKGMPHATLAPPESDAVSSGGKTTTGGASTAAKRQKLGTADAIGGAL
ncbi:unnamed protein product, partial [Prorocentrum cordatum]